jgi:LuxR family maltose regulon positive regulatory protein
VGALPLDRLRQHPILAPAAALASGLLGRPAEERRRFVALARDLRAGNPDAWTPYHEAALGIAQTTWVYEDLPGAVEAGRGFVELARTEDELAVPGLASLAFLLFVAGDRAGAAALAREALARPEADARPHGQVYAMATLSLVEDALGDPHAGESTARRALRLATRAGVAATASGGAARVALAQALASLGRLADAEHEAARGEELRRQTEPEVGHLHALLVLAGIRARRGRLEQAEAELARVRGGLPALGDAALLQELEGRVEDTIRSARSPADALAEAPSEAELAVLELLATDLSQREIGAQLYISLNTVKTHTRTLYRKLGVRARDEAVSRATALGLVEPRDSPG